MKQKTKFYLHIFLLCLIFIFCYLLKQKKDNFENETKINENDFYLLSEEDVDINNAKLNSFDTNNVMHTQKLCLGDTCIDDSDLGFIAFLPHKTDKELCSGMNCVDKHHFEYLNNFAVPGLIVAYAGDEKDIPSNWVICDGKNNTPDLRNKFILGAGKKHKFGEQGGQSNIVIEEENLPKHSHNMQIFKEYQSEEKIKVYKKDCGKEPDSELYNCTTGLKNLSLGSPSATKGAKLKTHKLNKEQESVDIMPPFTQLIYIMMVSN